MWTRHTSTCASVGDACSKHGPIPEHHRAPTEPQGDAFYLCLFWCCDVWYAQVQRCGPDAAMCLVLVYMFLVAAAGSAAVSNFTQNNTPQISQRRCSATSNPLPYELSGTVCFVAEPYPAAFSPLLRRWTALIAFIVAAASLQCLMQRRHALSAR